LGFISRWYTQVFPAAFFIALFPQKPLFLCIKKYFMRTFYKILLPCVLFFIWTLPLAAQSFVANPLPVTEMPHATLKPGSKAPDFRLPGTDGRWYTLQDFAAAKALVIIFTCNHCPTAQAYEDRLIALTNEYRSKGVAVVAISPNSPVALLLEECGYTDLDDNFESMQQRVKDKNYNFPYLYDGDDHKVSVQYGPVATPHVFVFDANRILQYEGRIDASEKPGTANSEDVRAALDALLVGKTPAVQSTKVFGCSTKWAWKDEWKQKIQQDWAAKPITLDTLNETGVKNLVANKTDKLLLLNVWATWCGPCVLEYPEFVKIQRMYGERDFEFVSISMDRPELQEKALGVLKRKSSALHNYIFKGKNAYTLIEALDPSWNGALPYTMLIEPGGKVAYKMQGSIKPLELRKIIVDHPKIGRYF
jgi:peroxiredoxin